MTTEQRISAAAVVFRPDVDDRNALADFARQLVSSGCRIGGMVQEPFVDDQGRRQRIDSVDLATGDRVTINQPSRTRPDGSGCTLDTAALVDSGAPLRRALAERPELVVIEKFGEQEQNGGGLIDDILNVIAEGLPTLVLVPQASLASWHELTGGESAEVACDAQSLRRWWSAVEPTIS